MSRVFLLSSGCAALTTALRALKRLSPRTDVILPAYTCFSVPAAVLGAGLRPVLCDIEPSTFDFDHGLLRQTIGPRTLCVIVHHLFGIPSNVDRTRALCAEHGAFVVEDAAQAFGIESDGRRLGTIGDAGIFSFGRGKNLTCGSGGAIVTSSEPIAAAIAKEYETLPNPTLREVIREFAQVALMSVFIRPRLYWIPAAFPFLKLGETVFPATIHVKKLSGTKAGLLRNWPVRLNRANRTRMETASYFGRCASLRLVNGHAHPYLRLPLIAESVGEKRRLFDLSKARGLGLSIAYPTPLNDIPEMKAVVNGGQFPVARRIAAQLLTIPTHQWLSEQDKKAIADVCLSARTA